MTKKELISLLEPFNDCDRIVIKLTRSVYRDESNSIAARISGGGDTKLGNVFIGSETCATDTPSDYSVGYDTRGRLVIEAMAKDLD